MVPTFLKLLNILLLGFISAGAVHAQNDYRARYGHAEMDISCDTVAKSAFTRGLLQLHSFAWETARESFQQAAELDSDCAMAYWGMAMSYYDSLHEHPGADEVELARQALQKAQSASHKDDHEQLYINAASEIYKGYPDVERVVRDRNYNQVMEKIKQTYPDDDEAAIFYALSMLALARRGEDDGLLMKAAEILDPMFKRLPEHPGIAHYLIHAYDDSGEREMGIDAAKRYAGIAPLMTHAQHMPAHIFAGIGMWGDSNSSNAGALEADPTYYHSLMYLVYGHLQQGQWTRARELTDGLTTFAYSDQGGRAEKRGLHSVNTWLILETRDWQSAADAAMHSDAGLDAAETLYVRGMGLARIGNPDGAAQALASINDLLSKMTDLNDSGISVRTELIKIMAKEVEASIAMARGQHDNAITAMRSATTIEDAPGVNRAPPDSGTGLPAHEVFGEILSELGRYNDAIEQFQLALKRTPNRLHSIRGMARAADLAGNKELAKQQYEKLLDLLEDADNGFEMVAEAKGFLAG
jgi:tetratricopeptide (TPR) repeat protein